MHNQQDISWCNSFFDVCRSSLNINLRSLCCNVCNLHECSLVPCIKSSIRDLVNVTYSSHNTSWDTNCLMWLNMRIPIQTFIDGNSYVLNFFYPRDGHVQSFVLKDHFCSVPVSLFSRECLFPQLSPKHSVAFVLITYSCELSLYANYHPKRKWELCQPISGLYILKI